MGFICVIKKISINYIVTVQMKYAARTYCKTACCPWELNFAIDCRHG